MTYKRRYELWWIVYAVLSGSGTHDLAHFAKAISSLCLGSVSAAFYISFLPRQPGIEVCFEMIIIINLEIIFVCAYSLLQCKNQCSNNFINLFQ